MMITDGQKSHIKELLERAEADLADYTPKELEQLTCREAANIIDDLKSELFNQRLKQRLYAREQARRQ